VGLRSEVGKRPGGFGIMLVRLIADELVYNERGNEAMLIKYLGDEHLSDWPPNHS
jgi:anti-sigma regulatory factor (Ser/Thr protein kinase)